MFLLEIYLEIISFDNWSSLEISAWSRGTTEICSRETCELTAKEFVILSTFTNLGVIGTDVN